MLERKEITKNTLPLIRELFHKIFPNEVLYTGYKNNMDCFEISLYDNTISYYISYLDNIPIGISGKYYESECKDSIWLGWFGVIPEYRKHGLGSEIFSYFEKDCKTENKKFCRLYTSAKNNDIAIHFYKNKGYILEEYNGQYPKGMTEKVLIASKTMCKDELILWNNKPMNF